MSKAIVIGAGISGLVNAKILAKHFDHVLILDKDRQAENPEPQHRKGLPQAYHQHILLMKGRALFETLFPGFDEELASMGSPELCYSNDVDLYVGEGKLPRFSSSIKVRPTSRTWIDAIVKKRVLALDNVEIQAALNVQRLAFNPSEKRVIGVYVISNQQAEDNRLGAQNKSDIADLIEADLVLDCSGRGSRINKWLKEAGYPKTPSTIVDPRLAYASCQLSIPNDYDGVRAIEVAPHAPDNPRAAGLWEIKKGTWLLTLIGMAGTYPPSDEQGFKAFANALSTNAIGDVLADSQDELSIQTFRSTQNIWRHYEKMSRYPSGLLVMGDALCAFNPIHGHGLTLIAKNAGILDRYLQQGIYKGFSDKWARKFYKRLNRVFLGAWMFAISEDMRWPETIGRKLDWKLKLAYRYTDKLLETCHRSTYLTETCLAVANMVRSPLVLMRPRVLAILLWSICFRRNKQAQRSGSISGGAKP
ncbi:MAG: hypothetical protein ACMZ64_02250 [Oleiphilus sp.]